MRCDTGRPIGVILVLSLLFTTVGVSGIAPDPTPAAAPCGSGDDGDRDPLTGGSPQAGQIPSYACSGIRPGARMTGPSGCTMNFVFTNGSDYYIGTAAHCVTSGDSVSVRYEGRIGRVVGQWFDWALVKVREAKEHRVRPGVCYWGGPTGMADGDPLPGTPLKHYGHGIVFRETAYSRPRTGVATHWGDSRVHYNGPVIYGDSGSPLITADGRAAGSVSSIQFAPWYGGVVEAVRMSRAVEMMEVILEKNLQLLTAPLSTPA